MGDPAMWDRAEGMLQTALEKFCAHVGTAWSINPGDGAFYGPKVGCSRRQRRRRGAVANASLAPGHRLTLRCLMRSSERTSAPPSSWTFSSPSVSSSSLQRQTGPCTAL